MLRRVLARGGGSGATCVAWASRSGGGECEKGSGVEWPDETLDDGCGGGVEAAGGGMGFALPNVWRRIVWAPAARWPERTVPLGEHLKFHFRVVSPSWTSAELSDVVPVVPSPAPTIRV